MIFSTLPEIDQPVEVYTIPDFGPTKESVQMDNWTKFFAVATLFCTVIDTMGWAKMLREHRDGKGDKAEDYARLSQFCAVKTVANFVNSLRRGNKPGMGRRALNELAVMEGLNYLFPTALLGLNWMSGNKQLRDKPVLVPFGHWAMRPLKLYELYKSIKNSR